MRVSISITIEVDIEKLSVVRRWAFTNNCVFVSKMSENGTHEVTLTTRNLYPHEVDPFIQMCREFSIPYKV